MIALPWRLAVRNLGRHRSRTLIVGLGIAVGMTAVVIQSGLVGGIRRQMIDHLVVARFGHVSIAPAETDANAGSIPMIVDPAPVEEAVREALPSAVVAPGLSALGMAFGDTAGTARVALWGVDPRNDTALMNGLRGRIAGGVDPGKDMALMTGLRERIAGGPTPLAAGSVYLGSALAERLEVLEGDPVTLSVLDPEGNVEAMDFAVAATLKPGAPWENYFVYLPFGDLQALMGIGDAVALLKVHLAAGPSGAGAAAQRLRSLLVATAAGTQVRTYRESGRLFMGIITATRIQAGLVEIVLLLAVGLGVAGAQILAIHERRREIGTMAALGTSRAMIRRVFLVEGVVLALAAGAAGTLAGLAVTWLLARTGITLDVVAFQWMIGGRELVPRVEPASIAIAMGELVLAVLLATLLPAARASRLLPVEALRGSQG